MVTQSKERWWCCVCWLYCTDLRVHMLCIWWHHPSGGRGVVSAGCTVLIYELICCVYGDTIRKEMVLLCVLVSLYWVVCSLLVYIVTPSKWGWFCYVRWLQCADLRVYMLCEWWHHPKGTGGVLYAGCTLLICELICCVYGNTIQKKMVKICVLVVLYWVVCSPILNV